MADPVTTEPGDNPAYQILRIEWADGTPDTEIRLGRNTGVSFADSVLTITTQEIDADDRERTAWEAIPAARIRRVYAMNASKGGFPSKLTPDDVQWLDGLRP